MVNIKLDAQALRYMTIFEAATNVAPKDCIEYEEVIYFVVYPGTIRKVLENNGEKVQRLRKILNKNVAVVEYSPNPKRFIKNLFHRYTVRKIELDKKNGEFWAKVYIDPKDKAKAIGKEGKNLKRVKEIARRHHPIANIIII